MQVNKNQITSNLFCSFLNEKQESYFQRRTIPFPTPPPFTLRDLKTDLKLRKVKELTTDWSSNIWSSYIHIDDFVVPNLYAFATLCSFFLFETLCGRFGSQFFAYDPVPRVPSFMHLDIRLKENHIPENLDYMLPEKHFGKSDYPKSGSSNIVTNFESTLFIPMFYILSKLLYLNLIKPLYLSKIQTELNKKIHLQNESIDRVVEELQFQGDEDDSVNPKDAAKAFPYLSDEAVKKLKFNQLQKAYKKNPEIFVEKLKKSLFSNEQLAIWRLFHRFQKADSKEKEDILSEPLCQELIASRVAFFELITRSIGKLSKHKIMILTEILKEKILIKELADQFEGKILKEMVKQVGLGESLKKLIGLKLFGIPKFALISSYEEKDFFRFYRFTESGKLKLEEPLEILKFIKMAKERENVEVFNWLNVYLKYFLETEEQADQHLNILNWAKKENLENIRLMIDVLLEKRLNENFDKMTEEEAKNMEFSNLAKLHQLAKEENLYIYRRGLKDLYGKCITFLEWNEAYSIQQYLNDFEEIFGDQAFSYRELLKEKIWNYLLQEPERIEKIASQAEQDESNWLRGVIMEVFVENQELFLPYWLTPYEVV